MKILSLSFKNINSLKGEWHIDFSKPPFCNSNLFAITGPTGAGKSSILDAICLALYHETPRVKVSKSSNELMTRHTGDCYAQVEFEVKQKKYRAFWSQRRAKKSAKGQLQEATAELATIDGDILTNKVSEVRKQIAELTGLNFARFTRSMLLSQGDFAAFLNASDKQRAELLEELTGTEIYSKISQYVYEQHKLSQAELQRLKSNLADLACPTEQQVIELEQQEQQHLTLINQLNQEINNQQQTINLVEKRQQILQHLAQAKQQQQQIENEFTSNRALFKQLDLAQTAAKIAPSYYAWQQKQHECNEIAQQIVKQQAQLTTNSHQNADLQQQLLPAEKEAASQQLAYEKTQNILSHEIIPLEQQINQVQQLVTQQQTGYEQLTTELVEQQQQFENYEHQFQIQHHALDQIKTELSQTNKVTELQTQLPLWQHQLTEISAQQQSIAKLNHTLAELKQQQEPIQQELNKLGEQKQPVLQQIEHHANQCIQLQKQLAEFNLTNLDSIEQEITTLQQQYAIAEQLQLWLAQYINNSNLLNQQQQKIEQLEQQLTRNNTTLEQTRAEYKNVKQALTDVELIISQQQQIASLQELRAQLEEGQACPLCGATEHPAIEAYSTIEPNEHLLRQQQLTEQLDLLTNKGQVLGNKVTEIDTELKILTQSQTQLMQQQAQLETQFHEKKQGLIYDICPLKESLHCEQQLAAMVKQLAEQQQTFSQVQKLQNQLIQQQHQLDQQQLALQAIEQQSTSLQQSQHLTEQKIDQTNTTQNELSDKQHHQLHHLLTQLEISANFKEESIDNLIALCQQALDNFNQQVTQLTTLQQQQEQLQTKLDQLQQQRLLWQQKVSTTQAAVDQSKKALDVSKQQLANLQQQRSQYFNGQSIADIQTQAEQDLQQAQNKLQSLKQQEQQLKLQNQQLNGELTTLLAQQEKAQDLLKTLHQKWLEQLAQSEFSQLDDFLAALWSEQKIVETSKLLQQLTTQQEQNNAVLIQLNEQLNEIAEHNIEQVSEQQLAELYSQLKSQQQTLHQQTEKLGSIRAQLLQAEQLQKQQQQLLTNVKQHQQQTEQLAELNGLIGSADGAKFRKFAQSLTLSHLIILANQHLQKLHNRYLLKTNPNSELGLQIIDRWQADTVRDCKTLSGGESFLVSLALALALSDLVSDKTSIDSLFLDEGFGTLDADALDIALDALDNLNAQGKIIGVISHIDTMKERIDVQIKVNKQAGLGYSTLAEQFMR